MPYVFVFVFVFHVFVFAVDWELLGCMLYVVLYPCNFTFRSGVDTRKLDEEAIESLPYVLK
jgi:hypothetical protein